MGLSLDIKSPFFVSNRREEEKIGVLFERIGRKMSISLVIYGKNDRFMESLTLPSIHELH